MANSSVTITPAEEALLATGPVATPEPDQSSTVAQRLEEIESAGNAAAANPKSTARGLYQFLAEWYNPTARKDKRNLIKELTGKDYLTEILPQDDSPAEHERSAKFQREVLFPAYWNTYLKPAVDQLRKYDGKNQWTDAQLAALEHFQGREKAIQFLSTGIDPEDPTNIKIKEYLERVERPPQNDQASVSPAEAALFAAPEEDSLFSDAEAALFAPPPTQTTNPLSSFLAGAVQGVTLDFADEIAGGIESFFTNTDYRTARNQWRAKFKQAEQANPKLFMTGEISGGIATAFTPIGLAGSGLKGAVAAGAAIGGAYGLGSSEEEEFTAVAKDVLTNAAFGAATAGLLGGVAKAAKRLAKSPVAEKQLAIAMSDAVRDGQPLVGETRQAIADAINDNSAQILERSKAYTTQISEQVSDKNIAKNKEFMKWFTYQPSDSVATRETVDMFNSTWKLAGPTKQHKAIAEFVDYKAQRLAVNDVLNKTPGFKDPLQLEFVRYFQDPLVKGMEIDAVTGLRVEEVFNSFSTAGNRVAEDSAPFLQRFQAMTKTNRQVFKTDKYKLTQYLDEGITKDMSPEQLSHAKEWRSWFDDIRTLLKGHGVNVSKRPNYFPHRMADRADVYRTLRDQFNTLTARRFRPSDNEQFMQAVTMLNGNVEPKNTQEIYKIIEGLKSAEYSKSTLGRVATAAYQRSGVMPETIRQFDVERAALDYLSSQLKAVHFETPMQQLHSNIELARALGANNTVKALDHYFRRMSGQPSNAHAILDSMATKWRIAAKDMIAKPGASSLERTLGKTALVMPDLIGWSTAQIYPNLLGWNIYAPIRNMSQTLMTTAPEIGGVYGYDIARRGWGAAIKAKAKGQDMTRFLTERGLVADQSFNEYARRAIEDGIGQIPGVNMVEKFGKAGLYLYGKSDTTNRWITWHMGQEVAKDLIKGTAGARKFVNNLPAGSKVALRQALRDGNDAAVGDVISSWLVRKTQFNYGKAGLSQFGQDYGRLVSMFMKWGVMIGSDVTNLVRYRQGMEKITAPMQRYMAPLAVLMAGDAALEQMKLADDPRKRMLIGKSLKNFSPVNSVFSIGVPPLVSAPLKALESANALLDRDIHKAGKLMTNAVAPFVPGLGALPKIKKTTEQALGIEEQ